MQGDAFAQSILNKIFETLPSSSYDTLSSAAAAVAAATSPASAAVSSTGKDAGDVAAVSSAAASAASAAANAAKQESELIPAVPDTAEVHPTEAATPAGPGPSSDHQAVQPASVVLNIPAVSRLASDAVYVLHRSMVRACPGSSYLRTVMLERCYASLWQFTSRVWESWRLPGARLFEVGLVMEL